jgi:hypothetical protein
MGAASPPTPIAEKAITAVKVAQLTQLVRDNQLLTAFVLFVLWQTGALLAVSSEVSGVMC